MPKYNGAGTQRDDVEIDVDCGPGVTARVDEFTGRCNKLYSPQRREESVSIRVNPCTNSNSRQDQARVGRGRGARFSLPYLRTRKMAMAQGRMPYSVCAA